MQALVIDDSRTVRMILKRVLVELGFTVAEAGDGQEGLEVLQANPDTRLCLVDWNMPRMDGITFVRAVRQRPDYSDVAVMMVTSESGAEQICEALEAGANEFVMKPFTADTISSKLQMLGIG